MSRARFFRGASNAPRMVPQMHREMAKSPSHPFSWCLKCTMKAGFSCFRGASNAPLYKLPEATAPTAPQERP
jgi:hypothetical protein